MHSFMLFYHKDLKLSTTLVCTSVNMTDIVKKSSTQSTVCCQVNIKPLSFTGKL